MELTPSSVVSSEVELNLQGGWCHTSSPEMLHPSCFLFLAVFLLEMTQPLSGRKFMQKTSTKAAGPPGDALTGSPECCSREAPSRNRREVQRRGISLWADLLKCSSAKFCVSGALKVRGVGAEMSCLDSLTSLRWRKTAHASIFILRRFFEFYKTCQEFRSEIGWARPVLRLLPPLLQHLKTEELKPFKRGSRPVWQKSDLLFYCTVLCNIWFCWSVDKTWRFVI